MTTMSETVDIGAAERAARELLDGRIAAVRELATTRQREIDQQAALEDAQRAHAAAYQAALRAGWTTDELRRLDFPAPSRKAPGRPRRARRASPPVPANTADGGSPVQP